MGKVIRGPEKTQLLLHGRERRLASSHVFFFESELKNPLEAVDVDQFE